MDHDIDSSSSTPGSLFYSESYPDGSVRYSTGYRIDPASRVVRKRVTSSGRGRPERPFENTSFQAQWPEGVLKVQFGDVLYLYRGQFGTFVHGTYSGKSLSYDLTFPMPTSNYFGKSYYPDAVGVNPDMLSQAEVKCYNALRQSSNSSTVDSGLWYAERRETAELFAKGAEGLLGMARGIAARDPRQVVRAIKSSFYHSAKEGKSLSRRNARRFERAVESGHYGRTGQKLLEGLSDAWLGYNLGVAPLIQDLDSAHKRLQFGDLTQKCRVKASTKHSLTVNDSEELHYPYPGYEDVVRHATVAETDGYTATLVALPLMTELAKLSRLGLTNPANLLYQSTSCTFVLDYFWAMGPYLSALSVPMEFEFVDGSWTHRLIRNLTVTVNSHYGSVVRGWSVLDHTKRTVYNGFPFPSPPLSLRHHDLSVKQVVNVGLLALNRLKSMLGKRDKPTFSSRDTD